MLGLESTAPSAVPTCRRIAGQVPWICVERAQPHITKRTSLVSSQDLNLALDPDPLRRYESSQWRPLGPRKTSEPGNLVGLSQNTTSSQFFFSSSQV